MNQQPQEVTSSSIKHNTSTPLQGGQMGQPVLSLSFQNPAQQAGRLNSSNSERSPAPINFSNKLPNYGVGEYKPKQRHNDDFSVRSPSNDGQVDEQAKMEPLSTLNSNREKRLGQEEAVEMLDYNLPLAQAQPHEQRASSSKVEDQIDDSFQRHMSVLDETIGSQRIDDEEMVIAMAEDDHGTHGTQLTNSKSDAWYLSRGITEPKKHRRVAQQSSRKKGFPGSYSTPIEQVSRKNHDAFFKSQGQHQRRDLMADTRVGTRQRNLNQNISGPPSTMSHSVSKLYVNQQQNTTMVHLQDEHTSPEAINQSQSATPIPSNPTQSRISNSQLGIQQQQMLVDAINDGGDQIEIMKNQQTKSRNHQSEFASRRTGSSMPAQKHLISADKFQTAERPSSKSLVRLGEDGLANELSQAAYGQLIPAADHIKTREELEQSPQTCPNSSLREDEPQNQHVRVQQAGALRAKDELTPSPQHTASYPQMVRPSSRTHTWQHQNTVSATPGSTYSVIKRVTSTQNDLTDDRSLTASQQKFSATKIQLPFQQQSSQTQNQNSRRESKWEREARSPTVLFSGRHTHQKLSRPSPRPVPSIFTYQDEEEEDVVGIQFLDDGSLHGDNQGAGFSSGRQGPVTPAFAAARNNAAEYQSTMERYAAQGRVYVELRYCRKCMNQQPLRVKHCRKCERCVSTFDHHCPWVGNCVGERNKKYFIGYLWCQILLLAAMGVLSVRVVLENKQRWFGYLTIVLEAIFVLFVLNLIIFHSYILSKNITTWECLSWSKVNYLQSWPRKLGSPFDLGVWQNIRLFCCYSQAVGNQFVWKMPLRRPDFQPADSREEPSAAEIDTAKDKELN